PGDVADLYSRRALHARTPGHPERRGAATGRRVGPAGIVRGRHQQAARTKNQARRAPKGRTRRGLTWPSADRSPGVFLEVERVVAVDQLEEWLGYVELVAICLDED